MLGKHEASSSHKSSVLPWAFEVWAKLRQFYKLQLKIIKNVSYDVQMEFGMDQCKPILH